MTCLDVFLWIWYFTYVNQWYRAEPCRWNVNSLPRLNPPWEPNGIAIVLLLWNFIVVISFHNTWCIFQHLPCAYFSIYIRLCIFQHSIQKKNYKHMFGSLHWYPNMTILCVCCPGKSHSVTMIIIDYWCSDWNRCLAGLSLMGQNIPQPGIWETYGASLQLSDLICEI